MPILRHLFCGPEGARTPDPLLAKQMFFLLNYRPIVVCSHHVKELFTSYFVLHSTLGRICTCNLLCKRQTR